MRKGKRGTVGRRSRRVRSALVGAGLAGAVVTGAVLPASPASAGATQCAGYGVGVKGPIRNGTFCVALDGSGTYIRSVKGGNFGTVIPGVDRVCNPSMKIDIYNRYGQWLAW